MLSFQQFLTVSRIKENKQNDTAVFAFGRFNPMTSGHEKLIDLVVDTAIKEHADPLVFPSFSEGNKNNPLRATLKAQYIEEIFSDAIVVFDKNLRNHFFILERLAAAGYKKVIMVAGDDRAKDFEESVNQYISHEDPKKRLNLESFHVINAGTREGEISGSLMRQYAENDDWDSFRKGLPSKVNDRLALKIYKGVKEGLKQK